MYWILIFYYVSLLYIVVSWYCITRDNLIVSTNRWDFLYIQLKRSQIFMIICCVDDPWLRGVIWWNGYNACSLSKKLLPYGLPKCIIAPRFKTRGCSTPFLSLCWWRPSWWRHWLFFGLKKQNSLFV